MNNQNLFRAMNRVMQPEPNQAKGIIQELLEIYSVEVHEPESFTTDVMTPFEETLFMKLSQFFPNLEDETMHKLTFLTMHFAFMESTILSLLRKKEPVVNIFHVQLTDGILDGYREYLVSNQLPALDRTLRPPFGTPQQWMDLCDSLFLLYDGEPDQYIQQMIVLTS